MKQKIILSIAERDEYFDRMQAELSQKADVSVVGLDGYSLEDADIFIGKKMTAQTLDTANRLKAVFAYKTGVDDFPLDKLERMKIPVYNSHVNSEYIAQYAFSLALSLTTRVCEFDRKMRNGDWDISDPYWKNLFDMKVGIVGYGSIGKQIHKVLSDNRIPAYTIDRGKIYRDIALVPTLEQLCETTDLLMLALPKTHETDNMFDARIFNLLKGKYIVNVGRCNCINEHDLYKALSSHTLAGAAIDTWRQKATPDRPILKPFDEPFDTLDNMILSSHKAMQTLDGHKKYVLDTLDNVLAYLDGKTPRNKVNPQIGY